MSRAVFPGSFDPLTLGHLHLIRRAARLYDELIVVIAVNSQKHALFTPQERQALIEENIRELGNVRVETAEGLLVRKVRELGADVMVRGIRDEADFAYEKQIAWANHELDETIETVCLFAQEGYGAVSSSIIREFASYGVEIRRYVPENVAAAVKARYVRKEREDAGYDL